MFESDAPELLLSGPAGTGKSMAICARLIHDAEKYPGCRILIGRKTRVSMSQSILVTFETMLEMMGFGEVSTGVGRPQRSRYVMPNGSEFVCYGFDDPERIKSSEYDRIYVNENTELTLDDWEIAMSRLRNGKTPFHQALADANPGAPNHWLLQRVKSGAMEHIDSRHEDNPWMYDPRTGWTQQGKEYIKRLDALTGARKARLRYGQWVAAEGAVFEESWDPAKHIVAHEDVPEAKRYFASVDWGYRDPFVMQVWAWHDKRMYLVREVYQTEKTLSWCTYQAKCAINEFGVTPLICDPSGKSFIEQWIQDGLPARGADRSVVKQSDWELPSPPRGSIEVGIRLVEQRLLEDTIKFVRGCTGHYDDAGVWVAGGDAKLRERGHPLSVVDEMTLYAYPQGVDGKPLKEEPADLYNHGQDATRYACVYANNSLEHKEKSGVTVVMDQLEDDI